MRLLLAFLIISFSLSAYSIDLKFRWNDGFCQKNTNPGLNPNYFGECGNLGGSRLINSSKNNETLKGSNFNSIYGYMFNFHHTDLSYTSFRRAFLLQMNLSDLNADYIDLRGAIVKSVTFNKVSMRELLANGTRFTKTQFINCDLSKGRFEGANLQETQFTGSNLSGANLKNTSLLFTKFNGAQYDKETQLPFSDEEALKKGMIKLD